MIVAFDIKTKLIHITTDCVFSGEKKEPYVEENEKDANYIYTKKKDLATPLMETFLHYECSYLGPT